MEQTIENLRSIKKQLEQEINNLERADNSVIAELEMAITSIRRTIIMLMKN
jgi:hypothetical protein